MPEPGKQLFREEALERLSSPERLDQLMNVVNPRAWLPLASLGTLVAIAALWSVFGRLPLSVTGQGVLLYPRGVVQFQAPSEGTVVKLNIKAGDTVKKGDVIGTISQASLEQELKQEKKKLSEYLSKAKESTSARQKRIASDRQDLAKQKTSIEANLKRESIVPVLRQKNLVLLAQNRAATQKRLDDNQNLVPKLRQRSLVTLAQKREGLNKRVEQVNKLLPQLETQLAARRKLYDQKLVTADVMLTAQKEYFDSVAQLTDLESQQKELELQQANTERDYLDSVNQINELSVKLQDLEVQEVDLQRQYSQSLNTIDELNTKLQTINSQLAKLEQEDIDAEITSDNNIQDVRRKIAQLEREIELKSQIVSDYNGQVLEVAVVPGQIVSSGARLGSINSQGSDAKLMSVIYFPDKDGKQIQAGMEVQVTPSLVKRERYGGILGKVETITPFPVTVQDMSTIIGNENLAENIAESLGKAPVQVFATLDADPQANSGYKWSSSKGPSIQLSSGTTVQVRVKVGEVAPISYVIPILRSITGIY